MKLTSIDKGFQIIDLLNRNQQGLTLSAVGERLGFNKSTVHHILKLLISHGYAKQHPDTKQYALGYKFLEVSSGILANIDVRKLANPHMRKLQEEVQEAVHLTILRGGQVIYVDKVAPPGLVVLSTYTGFAVDAYAHAGGKTLLSDLSPEEIRRLYPEEPLKLHGKNTIVAIDDLLDELEKIRQNGYAVDDEEFHEGIRCVAAPIRVGGKAVAGLSISGSIFTMTRERMNRDLIGLVMKTSEKISAEMSG
jgi:IclR family transcriptional regulator, KDG regulon repressor